MARPKGTTRYQKEYDRQAYIVCSEGGFTIPKLAKLFGVTTRTIYNWMHQYESFLQAIKRGRDEFDREVVEECLLKRIKGFSYYEVTRAPGTKKTGTTKLVVTRQVKKYVPPNPACIFFFLKNRAPGRWGEKRHLEIEVNQGNEMLRQAVEDIGGLSKESLQS